MEKFEIHKIAKNAITKIQYETRQKLPQFDCRLATSDNLPLKLRTGWRFPYDLLLGGVRIREKPLILFVDNESGGCEIEYGNEVLNKIKVGMFQEQELPTLDAVEAFLKEKFLLEFRGQDVWIETSERIVAFSDDMANIQPYWRIGFVVDKLCRYSTQVNLNANEEIQHGELKPLSRCAVQKFDLGRSQFQVSPGNLTIRLKGFPKKQPILQFQWLILSCIAHAATHLAGLDYHSINYYDIHTEIVNTRSPKSPSFGRVENIPVISFPLEGGWVNDPTIICHEVGHAIWDLLFTYPPKCLDLNSPGTTENYWGIQEGFADYFAATLLDDKSGSILIGRSVPDKTIDANNYGDVLRCLIDGNRPKIPDTLDPREKIYGLGKRWANLLWDLRRQIEPKNADDIIFLAHFKPFTGECQPQDPIKAYFQSLKQAANRLGIDFSGWNQLAGSHIDKEIGASL